MPTDPSARMLDLDSPHWTELAQAHGPADDIPRLIAALGAHEGTQAREELWFGVWATLCPDRRVQTAAYAAVPHVLAITDGMALRERAAALHFAAEVESARHDETAPRIPDYLVPAYAAAVERLPAIVAELARQPWDPAVAQIMAGALLAGKRQPALARAVLTIGEDAP